jgi:hypothetical protein
VVQQPKKATIGFSVPRCLKIQSDESVCLFKGSGLQGGEVTGEISMKSRVKIILKPSSS